MSATIEDVMHDAERTAGMNFVERLLGRIGVAGAKAVFADPVERDGVTVIPVGKLRWGGGGGSGTGTRKAAGEPGHSGEGYGEGGGGGAMAAPVGYIELRDGGAEFVRIKDPSSLWPLMLAGGFAFWMVCRGLRLLRR